jgi:hypothetical protein
MGIQPHDILPVRGLCNTSFCAGIRGADIQKMGLFTNLRAGLIYVDSKRRLICLPDLKEEQAGTRRMQWTRFWQCSGCLSFG